MELQVVVRAIRTAFGARAVVAQHQEYGVIQLAEPRQLVDEARELRIHVRAHARVRLHETRINDTLVVGEARPWRHVGIGRRERRIRRKDAERFLPGVDDLPVLVPAHVELASIAIDPFARNMVRCMAGAECEVHEERLRQIAGAQLTDPADARSDQVFGQVIAGIVGRRRIQRCVVLDEVRVVLAALAGDESVVALEAPSERPRPARRGDVDFVDGRQMPLAEAMRRISLLDQHLGQEAVLARNPAVLRACFADQPWQRPHVIGVVVATRQQACASRRAQWSHMEVGETHPAVGDHLHRRHVDQSAIRRQVTVAHVVHDPDDDVGAASLGSRQFRTSDTSDGGPDLVERTRYCRGIALVVHWPYSVTRPSLPTL